MEVIVSDNLSFDSTEAVVKNVASAKLKYVRTPRRLSMCDNFEFALHHARGDYVLFLGDDDGLMPGACRRLADLTSTHRALIYRWPVHDYRWPEAAEPAEVRPTYATRGPRFINLANRAQRAVQLGGWTWAQLAKPYHNAISRELLSKFAEKTGRVFHSTQHDVFLAFALPALCPVAVEVDESLVINGSSAASIGRAVMGSAVDNEESLVFSEYEKEFGGYLINRSLWSGVPKSLNLIADAILLAISICPELYRSIEFNHDAYLAAWTARRSWQKVPSVARSVVRRRNEIRAVHKFRVLRYLAFVARFKAEMGAARVLKRNLKVQQAEPRDVWECAKLLDQVLRSPKATKRAA